MAPNLRQADQKRSMLMIDDVRSTAYIMKTIKSKLLTLCFTTSLLSFLMGFSQHMQAQTYTGSYSWATFSFDYSVAYSSPAPSTSALVTVTFTSALPPGLNAQLRLGPASGPFTFVNLAGSNPFTYTLSGGNCCPTVPFIFRFAYASGGLYESPLQNFPLPIILTDFSTSKNGPNSALLTWKTSSEINSDHFGIERSTDGITWDQIAKINAAGNSNTDLTYRYVDADFPLHRTVDKIFYYRLKLMDLDGSFKYSEIRGINTASDFSSIQVYPNPIKDRLNIDVSHLNTSWGIIQLGIYNHMGAEILSKTIAGSGIELIDLSHIPSGTYFVVVKQGLETMYRSSVIKVE